MKMELRYKLTKRMLSVGALGILLVCTSCLMFICDPFEFIIDKILTFSEGSLLFSLWTAPPMEIIIKIFAFNITNGDKFLRGEEKLNVTEIGPYVYREMLFNKNATFNKEQGTFSYSPHREYAFDKEKTVGDPKTDKLVTVSIPLVGLQAYLNDASFVSNIAYATFSRTVGIKPFMDLTIDQYMWGYQDKLVEMAHNLIPSWIDFKKFGIFDRLMSRDNSNKVTLVLDPAKYHSKTESILTEEERMSKYHIAEWNGSPGLKEWGYPSFQVDETDAKFIKKCSMVEGSYDGILLPRNIRPNRTITMFRKAFCRPVPLEYVNTSITEQGFKVQNYKLPDWMFATADEHPENSCYCNRKKCIKGIQHIGECYYNIPITISQPHFLNADPSLAKSINGLNPDVNKHGSLCSIQPDVGVPLSGTMRMQINLDVGQTKFNPLTRPFNGLNVPLFWVEITAGEIPPMFVILLHVMLNVLPVAVQVVKYLLLLGGLALVSGTAALILLNSKVKIPRGLSIPSEYAQIPLINIPKNEYFRIDTERGVDKI